MSGEEWRVLYTAKPVVKQFRVRCLNEACWRSIGQHGAVANAITEAEARSLAQAHADNAGHKVVVEGPAEGRE